jgi:hypothetical protein
VDERLCVQRVRGQNPPVDHRGTADHTPELAERAGLDAQLLMASAVDRRYTAAHTPATHGPDGEDGEDSAVVGVRRR